MTSSNASQPTIRRTSGRPATFVDMVKLLPDRTGDWVSQPPDRLCDRRTIYDYMDGAAEVYMTYAYAGLVIRTYHRPGAPSIIAEVFDMTRSVDAFGVFTNGRDEDVPESGMGQGAEVRPGLLTFWQDRYFVAIRVDSEEDHKAADAAAANLGRCIAATIGKNGAIPEVLKVLPRTGLIVNGVRSFYRPESLAYHCDFGDGDPLALGADTQAALGAYRRGGKRYRLLCVLYPTSDRASRAKKRFIDQVVRGVNRNGSAKSSAGEWLAVRAGERIVAVAMEVPSREAAVGLATEAVATYLDKGRQCKQEDRS